MFRPPEMSLLIPIGCLVPTNLSCFQQVKKAPRCQLPCFRCLGSTLFADGMFCRWEPHSPQLQHSIPTTCQSQPLNISFLESEKTSCLEVSALLKFAMPDMHHKQMEQWNKWILWLPYIQKFYGILWFWDVLNCFEMYMLHPCLPSFAHLWLFFFCDPLRRRIEAGFWLFDLQKRNLSHFLNIDPKSVWFKRVFCSQPSNQPTNINQPTLKSPGRASTWPFGWVRTYCWHCLFVQKDSMPSSQFAKVFTVFHCATPVHVDIFGTQFLLIFVRSFLNKTNQQNQTCVIFCCF